MPNGPTENRNTKQLPRWLGYTATVLLEVALTVGLILLNPILPISKFPIPYVLLIMVVAYLFGEGPAVLAFFTGLVAFTSFFVYPRHIHWPPTATPEGWARLIAFFLGTLVVGMATILVRRSKRRVEQLVVELDQQRTLLDAFMQHLPVGLAFHDRETTHLLANRALSDISRVPLECMVGKTVWDALPTPIAAKVAADIEKVYVTGEATHFVDQLVSLEGERYFDVQHLPVRTGEGEMIGVGAVVMETTEQVIARQQLERGYEREHRIAEALQESLLGSIPQTMACFGLETAYRAALDEARVGGDFYDAFKMGPHKIGVVIGDVSGKGLKAAIQVAMAKYSIRGRAYEHESPSVVLKQVNDVLVHDMDDESFVTAFFGVLDCESRTLTYANGGHEPALFWDSTNSRTLLLDPTGPMVGMAAGSSYTEKTIKLKEDDELLLSTDGLFEVDIEGGSLSIEDLLQMYTEAKEAGVRTIPAIIDQLSGTIRDDIAVLRVWVNDKHETTK